ncbi:YqcC family protein [Pseudomonas sp.]|uniref:YqcC family protein n=1 Tax=Pseudomonas sp. TaxID=306 RepID=UPI0019DC1DF2|nr:YqcC family protein [Pseudomonas sp.]MBF0674348.1 YqcC family protein [Pseudomonas sp.]
MNERILAIADQLLLIERELRQLGWWSAHSPSDEALASCEPFCVDTLDFAQWLQWIFLPRMRTLVEGGGALPSVSGIRAMADVVYRERPLEVRELLVALGRFDQLIGKAR